MTTDTNLRKALIRLAHANPDGIREHLMPLLKEATGLPRATRRPAGDKYRRAVKSWARTHIVQALKAGGVPKDIIEGQALYLIDRAIDKSEYDGPRFATQIEIMDWIEGKTKVKGAVIGLGGSWSSFGGTMFSFPDAVKAYIDRYGTAAAGGETNRVHMLLKRMSPAQKALAAVVYSPGSYGKVTVAQKDIGRGLDKENAERWIAALEWVESHSDFPKSPW